MGSIFTRYGKRLRMRAWMNTDKDELISPDIPTNIKKLYTIFCDAPDLITTKFLINQTNHSALLVYLDGMVDKPTINNHIMRPLLFENKTFAGLNSLDLSLGSSQTTQSWRVIEKSILRGQSALFIEGEAHCLLLDTQGWPQREISEPLSESVLKGARQSFVESIGQNISMIRRYIPDRELKIRELQVGARSQTKIGLLYLADVINNDILMELEKRIKRINIDGIINVGELEELIENNSFTPFPQYLTTERPDSAASHILQGRIVIIVDQSPWVMVAPMSLVSFFQSADDYSMRWIIGSFIRLLRFISFFVSIFLPALYIAGLTFHYEIIPLGLILSIGESRERVPIPPFLEAIIMEITLEMLREAGLRLPSKIGQTVGIVGGIVIGQAAVSAGIVSNIMVIVVAATAIASFILPNADLSAAVRVLRFPMMVASYLFGIVGIVIGMMVLIVHLISLESLGTPYGSPLAPLQFTAWKDSFVRLPIWSLIKRPQAVHAKQEKRQGKNDKNGDEI
ncbi:spore germination protein [Brevibacillus reuszeri]|uniref:Spore germination protein n=3 Tax=Brevibacillus reuszeri TaxID=54915 RepID=A0ABQ0TGH8_9BACL|nr:spore germination protein [Brevibacillus reuszeri]GED67041.1 spore germination protein [Brevibacillus reuszeri]